MRRLPRRAFGRSISIVLVLSLVLTTILPAVTALAASLDQAPTDSAPPAQTPSPPAAPPGQEAETTPTVIRELPEKRTETSKTFLLSNGGMQATIYQKPIHFKNGSGDWQDIDTSLVPENLGEYTTAASPMPMHFRGQDGGKRPVRMEGDGWAVELDMLGVAESSKIVLGNQARYLRVATDTDLIYEAKEDGLKETLVLASTAAPNTFSFSIQAEGLEVTRGRDGGWVLSKAGESVLGLAPLVVFDSSGSGTKDPAYSTDAKMNVQPVPGGALVTYEIPRTWLDDPARVFPVMVDPSLTRNAGRDTYVASAYPTTSYGSNTYLKVGESDSSNNNINRSFVWFDLSLSLTVQY